MDFTFSETKRVIYVCSPYAGDMQKNRERAIEYCRKVIKSGNVPVAPHLIYPQILDDNNSYERRVGLDMALELLERCDEVWVFGDRISEGMNGEICRAAQLRKVTHYIGEPDSDMDKAVTGLYLYAAMEMKSEATP